MYEQVWRFSMPYKVKLFTATLILSLFVLFTHANAQTQESKDKIAIQNVIEDQLNAFKSKDHERAFSHAAPLVKEIFKNTDKFISMVQNGYQAIYNSHSYSFSRNLELGDVVYQEVFITDQNGKQWQAVYTLRQQDDGSWKITGVKMEPTQGAAT